MLPHVVYFEALKQIQNETNPAWHVTAAGLVVLRLTDAWLAQGAARVMVDGSNLAPARETIAAISDRHQVRSIFTQIVDIIDRATSTDVWSDPCL